VLLKIIPEEYCSLFLIQVPNLTHMVLQLCFMFNPLDYVCFQSNRLVEVIMWRVHYAKRQGYRCCS